MWFAHNSLSGICYTLINNEMRGGMLREGKRAATSNPHVDVITAAYYTIFFSLYDTFEI